MQPEWDGRTLIVTGASQGGGQAIAAAGLDARVSFIAAGIPALCDHTGVVADRANGWPGWVYKGPDGKYSDTVLEAVRYFDGVNFCARTKASALFVVGFNDSACTPSGVYAAFNNLKGKKQIINEVTNGHFVNPESQKAMNDAIVRHVTEQKAQ